METSLLHLQSMLYVRIISSYEHYMCVYYNDFYFVAKPIMLHSQKSIIKDRSNINVMLACDVKYAYPTAKITWNITTESSNIYRAIEENSTGNYILHNNGSLEIYHRFIYEEDHVMVMCLATNKYGSAHSVFHVWDPERFNRGLCYA